jgi:hypothetical protein
MAIIPSCAVFCKPIVPFRGFVENTEYAVKRYLSLDLAIETSYR